MQISSFVVGVLHTRRLNLLANAMRKPMAKIFSKFQGTHHNTDYHTKVREDRGSAGDGKVG